MLYSRVLKHDPADPEWPDRDRFVLSNGHASILQYSMLYLTGYGLELSDIEAFRQFESRTPGHPEARHTPGVEVTTGPLGQGFGDAVGMAIAERVLRERFGADLVDHHTYVIAGDGCFMEGISHEAASLAGHLGLGRLICVYDDNRVTIDGPTALSYSDDVGGRFEAYGWHVEIPRRGGRRLRRAGGGPRQRPAPTSPARRCSSCARTSARRRPTTPTTPRPTATRSRPRTSPAPRPSWASPTSRSGHRPSSCETYREAAAERGAATPSAWQEALDALDADERAAWDAAWEGTGTKGWEDALPTFALGEELATRQALVKVLAACFPMFPGLVSGAADLTGNTGVKLPDDAGHQSAETPGGRQVYYGIREHGDGLGVGRHGHARRRAAGHRHVLRVPRLHAPTGPPGRRCSGPRSCSCSATTRSASARTARPTSPSSTWRRCGPSPGCRSSGPPTPTRPPPRGAWPSSTAARRRSC